MGFQEGDLPGQDHFRGTSEDWWREYREYIEREKKLPKVKMKVIREVINGVTMITSEPIEKGKKEE